VVGFKGNFFFDMSKPDGTPRKFLDTSRLTALGWSAKKDLRTGIAEVYEWFKRSHGAQVPIHGLGEGSRLAKSHVK
jgi:GDP-L-fucose synthase